MLDIFKNYTLISSVMDELVKKDLADKEFKNDFYKLFQQPRLQIGIIGKMKTGKSALVNALIFGKAVLTSTSEPATATLTKIFYGDKDCTTVEFLSQQDIEAIRKTAGYAGDDPDLLDLKEAAEELLDSLPADYAELLGKKITHVSNDELQQYVAASGKYSGLVKFVTMEVNNENLKGISIIDTPGFNDPVLTRGTITRDFLKDCHVILFVHNSDGYDIPDGKLLNSQVEYAGVSKLVDVFNKMDSRKQLPLGRWDKQIESFLEDREEYLSEEKYPVAYRLVKNSDAVAVSAFMALCGQSCRKHWSDYAKTMIGKLEERNPEVFCGNSQLTLEETLLKYSNIEKIVTILNETASKSTQYLMEKPLNTLIGKLKAVKENLALQLDEEKSKLSVLQLDKESVQSDINGFNDFMLSVRQTVNSSPLSVKLSDEIVKSRQSIYEERETKQHMLNEENYLEPEIFSTGVTNTNIASYNVFLASFQQWLRTHFMNLSDVFTTTTNAYIGEIFISLHDARTISEERLKLFKSAAMNYARKEINEVLVEIPSYSISEIPAGDGKQWSRLFVDFGSHYDDAAIEELLKNHKELSQELGKCSFLYDGLTKVQDETVQDLQKSPAQLTSKIQDVNNRIDQLQANMKWIDAQLESLKND